MPLKLRSAAAAPLAVTLGLICASVAHAEVTPTEPPAPAASENPDQPAPASIGLAQAQPGPAVACDSPSGEIMPVRPLSSDWRFTFTPYIWFAGVRSKTTFQPPSLLSHIETDLDANVLSALQFGFMSEAELRHEKFSAQTDFIYLDLEQSGSRVRDITGPFGRVRPVGLGEKAKLKATVWTLSGGYDVFRDDRNFIQLFAGFRYLNVDSSIDWAFQGPIADVPRTGSAKASADVWDGIVGARGESALGSSRWKVIYYADIGAGGSKLTYQASAQLAYAYRWGDLALGWRYLKYEPKNGELVESLRASGPIFSARFPFGG